ncbi:MAG: hypothetical protein ACK5IB_05015 [Qingshengfaniella sp.]
MASFDTTPQSAAPAGLLSALGAPFRGLWNFLVMVGENNAKLKLYQRLSAMSDDELARRGLNREDLIRRIFVG